MASWTVTRQSLINSGFWFAWGVLKLASCAIVGTFVITIALVALGYPAADDSDVDRWTRSGMRPRTDALTGCQYLESSKGALTPRLDSDGQQVCRRAA